MSNAELRGKRARHQRCRALGFMAILAITMGVTAVPAGGTARAPAPVARAATPSAPVVDIAVTPDGFSAPPSHSSGVTTFRATTTVTGEFGSIVGLVQLRPGTAAEAFATHLGQIFTADRATAVAAARALMAEADLIGGVQVQPDRPGTFTVRLRPGTYYLFDYVAFEFPPPAGPEALHQLTITEDRHRGVPPAPRAAVWSLHTPTGPIFHAPSRIPANRPILFTNLMGQVNEAIFMPVHPDTTDADVQAFFESLEGGPPAPSPFTGRAVGSPPISPGRSSVLRLHLPPGRYALITFVFDLDDGVRLAVKGMHRIVTVGI